MINVYDSADNLVASFDANGSADLAPGDYYWVAIAGDGFEFKGDTAGEFTIASCQATVSVTFEACTDATFTNGSTTTVIDPGGAVIVMIYDDGEFVSTFSGAGGAAALAAGTYTWEASANAGFALTGDTSGQFTVDACPDEVLDIEILPFTVIDSAVLLMVSLLVFGLGVLMDRPTRATDEE